MTIKRIKRPPDGASLALEGRLDSATAPKVQEVFLKAAGEYKELYLDFAKLDYTSSAGLRALLALQKQVNRNGGRLTLLNVNPVVMEVFEMTGLNGFLNIV